MSTFITKINTAIKRRSSGLGTIMVPGYNKGQLWHLIDANGDSLPMLAEDIYEEAINEGNVKKLLNDFEL
jgi:hypothetical protein